MSARQTVDARSVPRFAAHVRLQFDPARHTWTIQAPEKAFLLDETAYAIVSRCRGEENLHAIVDDLCRLYADAPREVVGTDAISLVQDFVDKGVLVL